MSIRGNVLILALCGILFAAVTPAYTAVNLLANGSFESTFASLGSNGIEGYSGKGWRFLFPSAQMHICYESLYGDAQFLNRGPVHIHAGTDSIRFTSFTAAPTEALLYQDIEVTPGENYNASVWVYLWDNIAGTWSGNASNFAGLDILELDANKAVIASYTQSRLTSATQSWVQLSRQVTAGLRTRFIRYILHANYSFDYMHGHATFDDATLAGAPSNLGNWSQFRGNGRLTGRYQLKGNWSTPVRMWSKYVGARETLIGINLGQGETNTVNLPTTNVGNYNTTIREWNQSWPEYDLDGTGARTQLPPYSQYKIGKFTSHNGLQKIELDGGVPAENMYGHLYIRSGGAWVQAWKTEYIPLQYASNTIVGDFDGDSQLEFAHQAWYDLHVRKISDGTLKYPKCRFMPDNPTPESGRGYGWFGAFDLDNDGRKEFIGLAHYENHVHVVGWKFTNGQWQLERKWYAFIEKGCVDKKTMHQPITNGVQDVDGDGRPEIVTNIYNWDPNTKQQDAPTNPAHWRVVVYDGMTGNVKGQVVDGFISGLLDSDGDGTAELFVTRTDPGSSAVPDRGQVEVLSFKNSVWATRFSQTGIGFQMNDLSDLPLNVNSCASKPYRAMVAGSCMAGGLPVFVTRQTLGESSGNVRLSVWHWDGTAYALMGSVEGPYLDALYIKPSSGGSSILIKSSVPGNDPLTLTLADGAVQPSVLASQLGGLPVLPVTAARLNTTDTKPTVVVQGGCERMIAFEASANGTKKWSAPGRGMQTGGSIAGPWLNGGVLLADLDGDGKQESIAAVQAPSGCGRLVAYNASGVELWHHDFTDIPGNTPEWASGGVLFWLAGHFTSTGHCDILVDVRESQDSHIRLLDGLTGAEIARRTQGGWNSNMYVTPGGWWWAVFDYDGDGLDDALSMNRNVIIVVKGNNLNGNLLLNKWVNGTGNIFADVPNRPGFVNNACPVVDNWLPNGLQSMLYGACQNMLSIIKMDGSLQWATGSPDLTHPLMLACLGDINGDGAPDMLSDGHRNDAYHPTDRHDLQIINPATGAGLMSMTFQSTYNSCGPASCDIDGDGRDDFVTVWDNKLHVIGTDTAGTSLLVKWMFTSPSGGNFGSPAIIDADGSGNLQVVVACSDGFVYAYGQPFGAPPTGTVTINSNAEHTATEAVMLALTATPGDYPVSQVRLSNNNTAWSNWSGYNAGNPNRLWMLDTGDGIKSVYVQFKDTLGNVSIPYSDTITLDTTPPHGSVVIGNGVYATSSHVNLSITASDNVGSVQEMRISNDSSSWAEWRPYAQSVVWDLSEGRGVRSVYVQFRDAAANESSSFHSAIVVGEPVTIPQAKAGTHEGTTIFLGKIVTAVYGDCAYIQEPGVPSGIKAIGLPDAAVGQVVDVAGALTQAAGETNLQAIGSKITSN